MSEEYSVPEGLSGNPAATDVAGFLRHAGVPAEQAAQALDNIASGRRWHDVADERDRDAVGIELRRLWGEKADANLAEVRAYVRNHLPAETEEMLHRLRSADGRATFNDAANIIRLHGLAQRTPKVMQGKGIEEDIAAIEQVMSSDPEGYRRDEALQMRLRSLYEQREARNS